MSEAIEAPEIKQELNPTFHARFREGRKLAGYSLRAVGEAAGVSLQAISNFEAGRQQLQLANFIAACDLLHLNVRWVLKGLGTMWEGGPPARTKPRTARRVP